MSSREFNQDIALAKRAARNAPVLVTDRGKPTHVLLSVEAFRQMSGESRSLVDMLAVADAAEDATPAPPDPWATSRAATR